MKCRKSNFKRRLLMKIMFEDLKFEAQMQLLNEAGVESPSEKGWHVMPVAVVNFEQEVRNRREDNVDNDLPNCDSDGSCN